MRVAVLLALVGCGRVGFDPRGDGSTLPPMDGSGSGGTPLTLALPAGGQLDRIAVARDAAWYAVSPAGDVFRSDDHTTWTACGAITATGLTFSGTTIYASGAAVLTSSDRCATWQPTGAARYSQNIATASGGLVYQLADDGLYTFNAGSWQRVPTPADGTPFWAYAEANGIRLAATKGAGVVHSTDGVTWTQETAGMASTYVNDVASVLGRNVLIAEASGASSGGVSCSDGTATGWSVCYGVGGTAVAIDPGDNRHILAAIYDNLVETTDAFTTSAAYKRGGAMGDSIIRDMTFQADRSIVLATESGIYYAAPGTLTWEARSTALATWNISAIARGGTGEVYIATSGGVLHGAPGEPYTHSFAGMNDNNEVNAIEVMPDGSALAVGRHIWASTDHGATWTTPMQLGPADAYRAFSIALDGARAYVGTASEVYSADPPYTTWMPHTFPSGNRYVGGMYVTGGALWAATDGGLYTSTDQGASFQPVAAVSTGVTSLAEMADGTLIAGDAGNGVWVSDGGRTTWQHTGMTIPPVFSVAVAGTTILAATDAGVYASTDRGATWTPILMNVRARAMVVDPADGKLVVGTIARGLVKVAIPP